MAKGALVARFLSGPPAAEAGLQPRDAIVQVNRQPVQTVEEFRCAIETGRAGEQVLLLVQRGDTSLSWRLCREESRKACRN
jgi:S1-C subfamily serine protease